MTINPDALKYSSSHINEFIITAQFYNQLYTQILSVDINRYLNVTPIPSLGCRVAGFCTTSGDYKRIAPTNDIILEAACVQGCTTADTIYFNFTVYKNTGNYISQQWVLCNSSELSHTLDMNSAELTLQSAFFTSSASTYFQIVVTVTTVTNNVTAQADTSIVLKKGSAPANGRCQSNAYSGRAKIDSFKLSCVNWTSEDGMIVRYEYFGKGFFLSV